MDSALKQLRVNDLKRILADAGLSSHARAKKDDLVTRILESEEAIALFRARYLHDAEPQPAEPIIVPDAPPVAPAPVPDPAPVPSAEPAVAAVDTELEKRKARADRFGIPLINPPPDDKANLKARAERFGFNDIKKRSATEQVDPEELEKRRKRAERFGTKTSDASS